MIAPLALVVDIHALLALAGGLDHRAVGLDDRFLEEGVRLLTPDLPPRGIEDFLQKVDVAAVEATAEIARRRRIGDATGTQGVKVRFVVAQQFQVLQARAASQQIVSNVQHVIRLVIRKVYLQHSQVSVDRLIEPQLPH